MPNAVLTEVSEETELDYLAEFEKQCDASAGRPRRDTLGESTRRRSVVPACIHASQRRRSSAGLPPSRRDSAGLPKLKRDMSYGFQPPRLAEEVVQTILLQKEEFAKQAFILLGADYRTQN